MFAFGGLVLASSLALLRGRPAPMAPLWVAAAAYVAFGVLAFAVVSPSVHFLGYSAMGVLVAIGATPARAR